MYEAALVSSQGRGEAMRSVWGRHLRMVHRNAKVSKYWSDVVVGQADISGGLVL